MKKFLREKLHILIYAVIWMGGSVLLPADSWAYDLEKNPEVRGNFYFEEASLSRMMQDADIVVRGRVISFEDDEGLPGVNIMIKGTTTGVVTDIDGNYTISVPSSESVLVFSFIGFVTEEVVVGAQTNINLTMMPDITSLGEVVVVGYGEQKKETVVGAVTQ